MSSEDIGGLVPGQRIENGLSSPLLFQDDPLRFNSGGAPPRRVGDPSPKTRELGGFIDDKMFTVERDRFFTTQGTEFRRNVYAECSTRRDPPGARDWNGNGSAATPSGDDSDSDDDEDDDGDGVVDRLVTVGDEGKRNSSSINDVNNNGGSVANGRGQHHSPYVSGREIMGKDSGMVHTDEDHPRKRLGKSQDSITVAETDCEEYYSHYLQGAEGSASMQKVMLDDNGCGFSGRKDVVYSSESGESLRAILSDPVT